MNFDFSDAQKALKQQTRDMLRQICPLEVPRRILEGDETHDDATWQALVDMEAPGIAIPEEYGGIGFGYLELCVVAEELGRAIAPVPFSSSVYEATEAILLGGSEDQKKSLLPELASGKKIGTFAISEGPGAPTEAGLATTFDNGKLTGTKTPVADGEIADFAIVIAKTGSVASAVIVDLKQDSVTVERIDTIDPARKHATITFKNAAAEALGSQGEGWALKNDVQDRAAVLYAMEQVGGSDACLAMAVDYAKGRYAFGRPIGSFQAIKHKLADMYIKNELARANAYFGAWALSTSADELPQAAAAARVAATDAYYYATKENIQTHGGIGFTWESDCHLFYRRAKQLSLNIGSARVWKDRLVGALEVA